MRLIFINRFFYPDHSATSQMLSDLAFGLAGGSREKGGREVGVITSRLRYDDADAVLPARETIDGVTVHRVWISRFGRHNLLGRAVDYLTFYLSAAWCLWCLARKGDVVIAKTDPPMLSVMARPVCRLRGAHLVNWLQDIFPETAQALGVGGRRAGPAFAVLRWLRDGSLKAADCNVVLGERMAARVEAMGVPAKRIAILSNWADGAAIVPTPHDANPLRAEWGLNDAFVVGYSGNLGRAHETAAMLEAMTLLEQRGQAPGTQPVVFLFIGSGALFAPLKAEVARRGLTSARFMPYQPKEKLAQSLSAADVHMVSLRPELEGLVVPSKFYGIAAAGRPTLFVGEADGEVARLVARHECGVTVPAGDGAALAAAIGDLAGKVDLCANMGTRARAAFDEHYDKPLAIARWDAVLSGVGRNDRG